MSSFPSTSVSPEQAPHFAKCHERTYCTASRSDALRLKSIKTPRQEVTGLQFAQQPYFTPKRESLSWILSTHSMFHEGLHGNYDVIPLSHRDIMASKSRTWFWNSLKPVPYNSYWVYSFSPRRSLRPRPTLLSQSQKLAPSLFPHCQSSVNNIFLLTLTSTRVGNCC